MKNRSPIKSTISSSQLTQDKLKIIIRLRPILNEEDPNEFVKLQDDNTLQIKRPGNYTYMKFNNIIPPYAGQKDVFVLLQDSIQQFLSGTNITLFAYGQTGAGKTYSMIGNYSPQQSTENLFNFLSSKERGVLSRSLQLIMKSEESKSSRVCVSFFEIYNDKIYDLYNNTLVPLDIRQSKNGEISIPELVNVEVFNMEDAIQYLLVGLKNRATGSTHANAKSSRSHSIFQINLEKQGEEGNKILSSLRIVDLAGSEKFKIPSDLTPLEKQIRIQELTSINGSLSCLGHCISALIQKSRTHIPFRNSKLTRILSDSLIGHGKMRFIICISPSVSASAETFSTLQFANRAKKAIFERTDSKSPNLNKKKSQSEELMLLKKQLQKQRQNRLVIQKQLKQAVNSKSQTLVKENTFLRIENQKLKQEVRSLMAKNIGTSNNTRFDTQKQNNFKEQMLNLPIFQKNRQKTNNLQKHSKNNSSIYNRKKAEFEKKIKKFIQSDSPPSYKKSQNNVYVTYAEKVKPQNHHKQQHHNHIGSLINQYSFQDHLSSKNKGQNYGNHIDEISCQDIWNCEHNDTNQFSICVNNIVQKACTKMNVPEFNDLKNEMQRARIQLLNLKRKDNQLQLRKSAFY